MLPVPVLQAAVACWIAFKVAALFMGQPHADEAYYWLWGQHIGLSYLDHPPLHAWLQGLVAALFGWNLFALRLLSLVTAGVTLWILLVWAKRLAPEDWRARFWLSAALFYSSPLLLLYTTVAIHDRVLVVCALVSLHFFAAFLADWAEGRRRLWPLYLGAVFLGLATLTKYTGALAGVGVAVAILMRGDLRPLLRSPHLHLAAALAIAIQGPVIYWNLVQGGASMQLHLARGFEGVAGGTSNVGRLVLETAIFVSPFAIVPMVRFVLVRAGGGFAGTLHGLGKSVFVVSSFAVLALAFFRDALFYWNIVAYAAFFAIGAWCFRTAIGQALQIAWGLVLNTALFVHLSVMPILPVPDASGLYGWGQVAALVTAARDELGADFAAAPGWRLASQLAFALGDRDVVSLSARRDGFDDWFDEAAHGGMDAVVLIEHGDTNVGRLARWFASFDKVQDVPVDLFGRDTVPYELYIGRGYIPAASPEAQ